jgi:hypothetical protein
MYRPASECSIIGKCAVSYIHKYGGGVKKGSSMIGMTIRCYFDRGTYALRSISYCLFASRLCGWGVR